MNRVRWMAVMALCVSTASAQQQSQRKSSYQTPTLTAATDTLLLTRAAAVQLALERNPQLEVAREQIAEFAAVKVQAGAIPDPSVTASLDQQPGFFRSAPTGQKNIGATLSVPFPDKIRLRGNVAQADVRNAQAGYAALQRQIAAQTAEQYDSLLVALRHRSDLIEAQTLANDFLKRTQARFDAGTAPRLDVIKAQVDVAGSTNDLISNERAIANASSALNRLIGRRLGAAIVATDSLLVPPPLPTVEQLETQALEARPELAGLMAERAGAHSAATLAREFWLPDLTLGVTRDVTGNNGPGVFSTGLAFPLPLFFWQHTRGEISQTRHRERELAASYRDLEAQVGQDVRSAYSAAFTALRQAIYIRDQLLPAARAAYRTTAASYAIGGSSAFEVIDARRTLLAAESQYSDALASANTSRSDLERAVSVPLDTIVSGTNP
ncbi:MAG: TolC family protein [Gemmatimonadota bacterium]|nr:TolC family protein [Gemmatimonadota bacterium]